MAKMLIVEDDQTLSTAIREWLELARHAVEEVHTASDGLDFLKHYGFDVVILDVVLPDMSGLEVLKQFRSQGGSTPFLVLTAKNHLDDKERGFDAGADDYLTKPFDMRELSMRLGALLRRQPSLRTTVLTCGDLVFDTRTGKVFKAREELQLWQSEYSLLEFFMRFPNHVFSTDDLLNYVWKSDSTATAVGVRSCISRLRKKLRNSDGSSMIVTAFKQGYRFEPGDLKCEN
jgi:DNA-binding response OmpR family regulator